MQELTTAAAHRRDQLALLGSGAALFAAVAAMAVLMAFLTSQQCTPPDSNPVEPSAYCKVTHFPGVPDTTGSWILISAIFGTPILAAMAGWVGAVATGQKSVLQVAALAAGCCLVVVLVLALFLAHLNPYPSP